MTASSNDPALAKTVVNNLGVETSPYLLQHQHNPVAWQSWGESAFKVARKHNKPILLSVGYSACHWCHVMAHESFDNKDTAQLMNELFVNIKVDREERPDIDDIYQIAHQLLTGRAGGWPLTVFLCPKTHLPFIAGTYFPEESAFGRIGFRDLLHRVSDFYHKQDKDFANLRSQIKQGFSSLAGENSDSDTNTEMQASLSLEAIHGATQGLLNTAERQYGGFGSAPKFPMPSSLERLFIAAEEEGSLAEDSRQHLHLTLSRMATGGICDHVNGGFFRYSTDQRWMIPHFEKMLYDNGPLLSVFAEAWSLFGDADFERAARGIAHWALLEMRNAEGAFYCAMDADSEDRSGASCEGGYYVWGQQELKRALSPVEFTLVSELYGINVDPNFEGAWHLHQSQSWPDVVTSLNLDETEARALQLSALEKLLITRQEKSRPSLDTKVLCSWNALMIRGLAMAARIFNDTQYLLAAQKAVDFIREKLWINYRLFASWQGGAPKLTGYLDDYVFLMDALLELLQAQWRDEDYRFLIGLAESVIHNFEDTEYGGFFFTAHDHEQLIHRNKPYYDSVMPSGNGVAAKVFGRLGHLAAEPRYLESAQRTLQCAWPAVQQQPQSHHNLLWALEELMNSPAQVLLTGDTRVADWQQQIRRKFGERLHCYWIPNDSELHPPEVMTLEQNQGLVCIGDHCLEPQQSLGGLMEQLSTELEGRRGESPPA